MDPSWLLSTPDPSISISPEGLTAIGPLTLCPCAASGVEAGCKLLEAMVEARMMGRDPQKNGHNWMRRFASNDHPHVVIIKCFFSMDDAMKTSKKRTLIK